MKIQRIYVGGWFQRTTLHLSEIYDFIHDASSPLDLDKKKLRELRDNLHINSFEWKVDRLEYIELLCGNEITVKIFEDGLIILNKEPGEEYHTDVTALTDFYEKNLSPGIKYLFSLGAPIPKELANIKTIYPYFFVLKSAREEDIQGLLTVFKQDKYFEVHKKEFSIYRGDKLYIINNLTEKVPDIERFIQEQIFLREFKAQLHRYLNLHRIIWERIADVKEKGEIKGDDVGPFYSKIERYAKTINLIDARIDQMGTYISTRESIVKDDETLSKFLGVLEYKYETLSDTLSYVKDIWSMTSNYVDSAKDVFSSIQAQSTEASVDNLTIVTSMGVGASLLGLFTQEAPSFTYTGILYFILLACVGYLANRIIQTVYRKRKYTIDDVEIDTDIK